MRNYSKIDDTKEIRRSYKSEEAVDRLDKESGNSPFKRLLGWGLTRGERIEFV